MKRNSGFIGRTQITTTEEAKGVHDLHDVHIKRVATAWPRTPRFISLTPSVTTVVEGNSMTFTFTTEHVENASTLYYTIATVSGTTMVDADFNISPNSGGVDGSFSTTNNSTVLTFGLIAEITPGDAESNVFILQIMTGSTSGPIVIESSDITVTDVVSSGTDIESLFYEISNRYINPPSTADYTGNYDVGEVQVNSSGSKKLYLALKQTTGTTYYNDICIAAVQVLNSSNVVQQTWNFSGGAQSWQTTTSQIYGSSSLLSSYITPTQAAAYTYANINYANSINIIGLASSTGSNSTGCADGISSTNTNYPVGDGTVAQSSSTNYIYREVSSSTRYSNAIARSPSYTFSAGDKIRVVHNICIPSSQNSSINIADSIWVGIN